MARSIETEVVIQSLRSSPQAGDARLLPGDAEWIRSCMENNYWERLLKSRSAIRAPRRCDAAYSELESAPEGRRSATSRTSRPSVLA